MGTRSLLLLSLLVLVPLCCHSFPKKHKIAKRYVDYSDYDMGQVSPDDAYGDLGLFPEEVDALRNLMVELMDILDDGHEEENKSSRRVDEEGEAIVVIVVEKEDQDPNDLTLASLLYGEGGTWSMCTRTCTTRRYRPCLYESLCGTEPLVEEAFCYAPGSKCETTVSNYLESEGYIIVDIDDDKEDETTYDDDDDPDYVPDFSLDYDYEDESISYPDAAENTYGDYYDYGWADYLAGDHDQSLVGAEGGDEEYSYDEEEEYPWQEEEAMVFEGCGKSQVKAKKGFEKILGGHNAQRGLWPWQVAIMDRFKETFCGGTLIAPHWILTAAHCIRKRLYVRLAEHNLYTKDKSEVEMRVDKSIGYPEYNDDTFEHDIALLKLPKEIQYNRFIIPACLPSAKTPPPTRSKCVISGWGKEKDTHIFGTDVLKYARVPIVTKSACLRAYPDHPITQNQFCAGFKKGSADTCGGDSGGPLVCNNEGAWTVHGVTSFGEGCGDHGKFGVYTKVKNYLNWIKRTMSENS